MALQCFGWIAHVLQDSSMGGGGWLFPFSPNQTTKIKMRGDVAASRQQLPDDIIMEILSRLPAKRVIKCRRVCRSWKSLTSTQYFINLHLSRAAATPTIFGWNRPEDRGCYTWDPTDYYYRRCKEWFIPYGIVSTRKEDNELYSSCGGLLLFVAASPEKRCYVFNPVTKQEITVDFPGFVRGFFYHPLKMEFNILYYRLRRNPRNPPPPPHHDGNEYYYIYTLNGHCRGRGRVWRKIKSPPFDYKPNCDSPKIFNRALHWISSWNYHNNDEVQGGGGGTSTTCGVVIFDSITEEFFTRSHPMGDDECLAESTHKYMSLLVSTHPDNLFFTCLTYGRVLDIWILEDYSNWAWVPKWKIDQSRSWVAPVLQSFEKPIHIQDEQMWLQCQNETGPVNLRLRCNTILSYAGMSKKKISHQYYTLFVPSLARLP